MSRGYPDYNAPITAIGNINYDVHELAARLGSISTIQRSGNVVWFDTFDEGYSAFHRLALPDSGIVASIRHKHRGNACMGIYPYLAGSDYNTVVKTVPVLPSGKVGFEWYWYLDKEFSPSTVRAIFGIEYIIQSSPKVYSVGVDCDTKKLYAGGRGDYWTEFTEVGTVVPTMVGVYPLLNYHYCKLTVNPDTGVFDKWWFDNQVIDLSSIVYNPAGVSNKPGITVFFTTNVSDHRNYLYIDSVSLTINEP